jgi:hypothetical protein
MGRLKDQQHTSVEDAPRGMELTAATGLHRPLRRSLLEYQVLYLLLMGKKFNSVRVTHT